MPLRATQPFRIVFVCSACGHILDVLRDGRGRHLGCITLRRTLKVYGGVCPNCGRQLNVKPEKLEFASFKEQYGGVGVPAPARLKHITLRIPAWMDKAIERLVESGVAKTKSQFIRKAVERSLKEHGVKI
jgi:hypothetical protein